MPPNTSEVFTSALYGAQLLLSGEIAANYLNARAVQARQQTAGREIGRASCRERV